MPCIWVQFSHAASDAFLSSRYKTGHCLKNLMGSCLFFLLFLCLKVSSTIYSSLFTLIHVKARMFEPLCLHVVVVLSGFEIWSICLLRTRVPPLSHRKVSLHPDLCSTLAVFWFLDGLLLSCSYLLLFFTLIWIHCVIGRRKVVQCGFLSKVNMNYRFYNILYAFFNPLNG